MKSAVSDPVDDRTAAPVAPMVRAVRPGRRVLASSGEPVTFGVPFARGALTDAGRLTLRRTGGDDVPMGAQVLDRWPDGSVRWALVDLRADVGEQAGEAGVEIGLLAAPHVAAGRTGGTATPKGPRVTAAARGAGIAVDTGAASFDLAPGAASPFQRVRVDDHDVIDAARTGLAVEGADGPLDVRIEALAIEGGTPLRTVVRADGVVRSPGGETVARLVMRLHFCAGSTVVRLLVTVHNPRRAAPSGRVLGSRRRRLDLLQGSVAARWRSPPMPGRWSRGAPPRSAVPSRW